MSCWVPSPFRLEDEAFHPRQASYFNSIFYCALCRKRHLYGVPSFSQRQSFVLCLIMGKAIFGLGRIVRYISGNDIHPRFFQRGWGIHFLSPAAFVCYSAWYFSRPKGSESQRVRIPRSTSSRGMHTRTRLTPYSHTLLEGLSRLFFILTSVQPTSRTPTSSCAPTLG